MNVCNGNTNFPPGTFNTRVLNWTLNRYSCRYAYIRALAAGKPRVDLSGNTTGVVTEDEQQQAVVRLMIMSRRHRKARKSVQAGTQTGGESPAPSTAGKTVTEDREEHQPSTARRKTTKKRSGKSGKVETTEEQG